MGISHSNFCLEVEGNRISSLNPLTNNWTFKIKIIITQGEDVRARYHKWETRETITRVDDKGKYQIAAWKDNFWYKS